MAAAPLSLGTQIREELSCSICLELFTRPKVLPCQHTFCQDCLRDHAGREGNIQCPNCRQKSRLPPKGVAGLPNNHIIANMCEALQQQTSLSGETSEQPQSGNTCSSHPSEVIKLYCKHCKIPICEQCLEEAHDDHLTTTIKKAAQQRCSTVQELLSEGRNILGSYFNFLKSLREEEETLIDNKKQTHTDILQAYKQKVKELRERRDHLLSEADKNHTKNLDRIQIERDRFLADINELSAACDQAEQELQQGWVELLSQPTVLTEVVGKYRRKGAPTPVQTQATIFQPVDKPGPILGHVAVQSSAPTPTSTALSGSSNVAARETGHHNGNRRQREQRVTFDSRSSGWQFSNPCGVIVSDEGEIFLTSGLNERIGKILVFTLQGTFVRRFSTIVLGSRLEPHDVALDGEGNLWVVGKTRSAEFAVHYSNLGRWLMRKIDLQKSPVGCRRGVAVDIRRNHILITQTTGNSDNRHGQILVFRPDGTLVRTVGACATWLGWSASLLWHRRPQIKMKYPMYITVDGEGNILVSDSEDHCVYVYREDGQFLFKIGSGEGQLKRPEGICTDRVGNIIVADSESSRVEMFDKTGKFLKHITTDMTRPQVVAMATQGQLVITHDIDSVSILQNV